MSNEKNQDNQEKLIGGQSNSMMNIQHQNSHQKQQSDGAGILEEEPKGLLPVDDSSNVAGGDDSPSGAGDDVKIPKAKGSNPKKGRGRPPKAKGSTSKKGRGRHPGSAVKKDDDLLIERNNKEIARIDRSIMENENNAAELNNNTKQLKDKKKQLEKQNKKETREKMENKQKNYSWLIYQLRCEKKGISYLEEYPLLKTLSKEELSEIKAKNSNGKYRDLITAIKRMEKKEGKD